MSDVGRRFAYRERARSPGEPVRPVEVVKEGPPRSNKVKVLQEILGHSRIDQTMNTYAPVMPHIQADAFGRFSRRFSRG